MFCFAYALLQLATAQKCTVSILFNSDLFDNPQAKCSPSGIGCTVEELQSNPPVCALGTRQDPVLDFSKVICKPNGKFSEPIGGCIQNNCKAPTKVYPYTMSPVAKCNTDEGCSLKAFNSAPMVCEPNHVGPQLDQSKADCPFVSGVTADFTNITGECYEARCSVPQQYSTAAYDSVCPIGGQDKCAFSFVTGLKCAVGYVEYTDAPIRTDYAVCNTDTGLWENIMGVCVAAPPPPPPVPTPTGTPLPTGGDNEEKPVAFPPPPQFRVPVPVNFITPSVCGQDGTNNCFLGAPWKDLYDCDDGSILDQTVNCITTGCLRGNFGQPTFSCWCKQIPQEKRIPGNQIYLAEGSCCPVNQEQWVVVPKVGPRHNSGYDAQCVPDGSDVTTVQE